MARTLTELQKQYNSAASDPKRGMPMGPRGGGGPRGPGMAKGGSGDVLAGMLVAFLGQKLPVETAVTSAVYLHGKAGDIATERFGEYSMTPSDVIDVINPDLTLTGLRIIYEKNQA